MALYPSLHAEQKTLNKDKSGFSLRASTILKGVETLTINIAQLDGR